MNYIAQEGEYHLQCLLSEKPTLLAGKKFNPDKRKFKIYKKNKFFEILKR